MDSTPHEPRQTGDARERPEETWEAWSLDHATLWGWVEEALDRASGPLSGTAVRSLCAQALEAHAPAALVHAQAAGLLLEHLICARVLAAYGDRFGRPLSRYDPVRLRATARSLRRAPGEHWPPDAA